MLLTVIFRYAVFASLSMPIASAPAVHRILTDIILM